MSGVSYSGVPEEIVLAVWVLVSWVLIVSITTSFADMAGHSAILPARLVDLNRRRGWPGRAALERRDVSRWPMLVFGGALVAMSVVIPVWSLLDLSIRMGWIDRALILCDLLVLALWFISLAVRWRRA